MHVIFEGQNALYREDLVDAVAVKLKAQGDRYLVTRHPGSPYDVSCVKTQHLLKQVQAVSEARLFFYLADLVQHDRNVVRSFCSRVEDGIVLQNKGLLSILINYVLSENDPVRSVMCQQVIDAVFNLVRPADLLVFCVSAYPGPKKGKITLRKWSREAYKLIHKNPLSLTQFVGTVAHRIIRVELNFAQEVQSVADEVVSEVNRIRRTDSALQK